jgi:hypothetical protein
LDSDWFFITAKMTKVAVGEDRTSPATLPSFPARTTRQVFCLWLGREAKVGFVGAVAMGQIFRHQISGHGRGWKTGSLHRLPEKGFGCQV